MQKLFLIPIAILLIFGCSTPEEEQVAFNENPFNLDILDDEIIPGGDEFYGESFPGDLPLAQGTGMRFVEADSGLLDPAIAAEAKMVLRDVHFPYNSSTILPQDAVILQNISEFMSRFPSVILQIQGYCDERGTEEYNMALGEKRAAAAKDYLLNLGVPGGKINIVSYGKTQPLVKGIDEETHFMNRRDEFIIIKK